MKKSTETEKKILAAAAEIFLEKGRDGARMHEIAQKAGINKALLHYYYRSKENLHGEVFKNEIRNFFEGLFLSIPETDDPRELLENFVSNYVDRLAQNPGLIRFIMWEIQEGGELLANTLSITFQEFGHTQLPLVSNFQQAITEGKIRAVDPLQLTISIIGMSVYPFIAQPILEKILPGLRIRSAAFLTKRKREIVDLLWQGIQK
ncbi:MAG: TetR/AcrR family transcriptional regulator [Calditrichia bacterium]